jgi:hypothetical protein
VMSISSGEVINEKYCKDNSIFYADRRHASPFWKGVMLAAQALKFGYRRGSM